MSIRLHSVRSGESLSSIAQHELGHARYWPQLFAFNTGIAARIARPLTDPDHILIGQQIAIPPRVASHPPYLRRRLAYRHPDQRTHPRLVARTLPAVRPGAAPALATNHGGGARGAAGARVNSPAFKFNLALCPPVERSTPAFDYVMKFEGQIILWLDEQVDLLTFTDKGVELADKRVAGDGLSQLLTSEKVTFDQVSKKLTYESLLTTRSGGMLNPLSLGIVADSSDPRPAFRFKCTSPRLDGSFHVAGHFARTMLWVAENLTITLDVRPNAPQGPNAGTLVSPAPATSPPAFAAGGNLSLVSPAPIVGGASTGSRVASATREPDAGQGFWSSPTVLLATAAIIATATLASNVVTWGADAEIDPIALGAAARLAAMAARR